MVIVVLRVTVRVKIHIGTIEITPPPPLTSLTQRSMWPFWSAFAKYENTRVLEMHLQRTASSVRACVCVCVNVFFFSILRQCVFAYCEGDEGTREQNE